MTQTEKLKQLYDAQLKLLLQFRCHRNFIQKFQSMKDVVIDACLDLVDDHPFPFLPVFPEINFVIYQTLFFSKFGKMLKVKKCQYQDEVFFDEPYYLIGAKVRTKTIPDSRPIVGINLHEAISLAIFSNAINPFYADRSRYLTNFSDTTKEKASSDSELGVWLNIQTGTCGPYLKSRQLPIVTVEIVGRITNDDYK